MFIDKDPSLSTYWRAIVLLGNNVASYKFALAKTLLEVQADSTLIRMEDLALPFALNVAQHLEHNDKQVTSKSSKFLDYCRQYNSEQIAQDELRAQAIKLGFVNVIDAFHKVSGNEVPRFFEDKRKDEKGIILTDNFYQLLKSSQSSNFGYEVESRWRLWETAISLGISPNLIQVNADIESNELFVHNPEARRISISSSRDALNGYQKGSCFYCSKDILIEQGYENSCDVDHFFPHKLKSSGIMNVDQVWNLVLACKECNRGEGGKFERIAHLDFLYALNDRNNYYVESHHPLRETIVNQTGRTESDRKAFLQSMYNGAVEAIPSKEKWKPRLRKELRE
ncbi:MAG: HNH endonuclease [Proteobacteria bacterium]|nr:HNH endonuclease [Pseudomonadota bacterium]